MRRRVFKRTHGIFDDALKGSTEIKAKNFRTACSPTEKIGEIGVSQNGKKSEKTELNFSYFGAEFRHISGQLFSLQLSSLICTSLAASTLRIGYHSHRRGRNLHVLAKDMPLGQC